MIFGNRKPGYLAIVQTVQCGLRDPTFSHFGTIPACDGQMDGHTQGTQHTALA